MPIVLPAFLSLVSLAIVILTFYQKPHESFLALGLVALGLVLYILGAKWKNKPKEIQDKIGEILFSIEDIEISLSFTSTKEMSQSGKKLNMHSCYSACRDRIIGNQPMF